MGLLYIGYLDVDQNSSVNVIIALIDPVFKSYSSSLLRLEMVGSKAPHVFRKKYNDVE
jgi:hypothetical protein